VGAAIFDIRISDNFEWFATVLFKSSLKEEEQDTSHIHVCLKKRANEFGYLTPPSTIRLRYFNYSLF
jgi:hypothetical protein